MRRKHRYHRDEIRQLEAIREHVMTTNHPDNNLNEPPERIWMRAEVLASPELREHFIKLNSDDIKYTRVRADGAAPVVDDALYQTAKRVLRWLYATMNPKLPIDKSLLKVTQFEIHAELEHAILDAHAKQVQSRVAASPAAPKADHRLIEAFKDTAIKAHIGFKHEGPWDECEWIECEDRRKMIEELNTATKPSREAAQSAAREIAREINGGDRADCTYPPALTALLDDCSIANEKALAEWLESIVLRHFASAPVAESRCIHCDLSFVPTGSDDW